MYRIMLALFCQKSVKLMQTSAKNIKICGVFFYMIEKNRNRKELMYDLVSITTKLSSCATFTVNKITHRCIIET